MLPTAHSQAGGYSTQDKKAIRLYEGGNACLQQKRYDCARSEFLKAAGADPRFVEPRLMLAEMAEMEGQDAEAIARIARALRGTGVGVCSLARCRPGDIEAAARALEGADAP
ncbi:MAG: hypothetical protein ACK4L7_09655, partial [Flavobacteriales bacterium]